MDFLLTQLYGPVFQPKSMTSAHACGRECVTRVGQGSLLPCPQHNPRPEVHTHCLPHGPSQGGSAGHLSPPTPSTAWGPAASGSSINPGVCLPRTPQSLTSQELKYQAVLIREEGGAGRGVRKRRQADRKSSEAPEKPPFSSCWGSRCTRQASPAAPQSSLGQAAGVTAGH